MANGKRSKRNDNAVHLAVTPSEPVRQTLPRRCKGIQPYYGIDNDFEDADERPTIRKKRGLGSSSSTKEKTSKAEDIGQGGHSPRRTLATSVEQQEERNENTMSTSILSWLVDMKVVKDNEMVTCMNKTTRQVIGQGMLTREGILCYCCQKLFPVSSFTTHRGDSSDKPYENIYIGGTSVSLLTCQIEAWNRHSVPAKDGYHHVVRKARVRDHHDDSCIICADGGDLICCEKCPSTYHPRCMGLQGVPQDEWLCPYCHCKYCKKDEASTLLLTCFQCLKKYHWRCCQENDSIPAYVQPLNIPFCGKSCWQLYQILEGMVGKPMPINSVLSWTLLRRMDVTFRGEHSHELHLRANCNSMVALAAQLLEDSFKLILDRQTRANMIQSVVYNCGSNFTRTNFSRFYTAVLEYQGQIVTVASLRMPSPTLAEIPFIATAESCRNKGMCKLLLVCIESALAKNGVERIIIPSAEDMVRNWQEKFGFIPIDRYVERELAMLNTLMFPKTTRLQKYIGKRPDLNLPPE